MKLLGDRRLRRNLTRTVSSSFPSPFTPVQLARKVAERNAFSDDEDSSADEEDDTMDTSELEKMVKLF
jgi:hypothetical protein